MTVTHKATCPTHGEVEGRMRWSDMEQELVISCPTCGAICQTYDTSMYRTSLPQETK